ncbi:MAG: DNA/RNA non-specific endonuclease [Gemmatimonadales bacterium]
MRLRSAPALLTLLLGAGLLSCSDPSTAPALRGVTSLQATTAAIAPSVVISQIYGGGGNSGATFTTDYIELHTTGGAAVSVEGWSVQYASSAGTSWQVTPLAGSIPAGGYFLVQEAKGAGGTTALPTPEVIGTIAMSATAGKVAVLAGTGALSGTCPAGPVDVVSFGTAATNCNGALTTPTLSNTTAAFRGDGGCDYTGDNSADFAVAAPAPRNGESPAHVCPGQIPVGPLDHLVIAGPGTVATGDIIQLIATPQDVNNQTVSPAEISWSSSDTGIAAVDSTGKVTGVTADALPVTITATATADGITRTATAEVTVTTPSINWIDVSSSSASLPPGFQTQLFATARVASGGTIVKATFTFEAVDPSLATIETVENTGILTGVMAPADGTTRPGFRITATPVGGGTPYVFVTHPVTIEAPVNAPLSIYATNDEFGDPTPAAADQPNDLLITRPQYTLSYNESRGTPNWVSYELDARQIVSGQDRCNCFTGDPSLPADKVILTSDYTNGGFDRGHMTRSFDRTAANVDNATTFYLSNIVPQMADLNQGVWAQFENALGDSATLGGRAVYIIAGPLYSSTHGLTFLKGEGKVAIPDSTWKVAIIGPRTGGVPFTRGEVQTWDDLDGVTVLAVNMPNIAGVRNDPWAKYLTTVDKIEASTGLDILSLLQADFQDAVEAGDHPPVAAFARSGAALEGTPIAFDASASTDPDLGRPDLGRTEALSYHWDFGDGSGGDGLQVMHAYADNGSYPVTLTVTDAFGWPTHTSQDVAIANVAPTVSLMATSPLAILSGDAVSVSGGFSDPGSDAPWQTVLDWGNGTNTAATAGAPGAGIITGSSTYLAPGPYTISLTVTDKDGAVGTRSLAVSVGRRPVVGEATPGSIKLIDHGGAEIKVTLHSDSQVDISTLDLSTVMVGTVGLSGKKVKFSSEGPAAGQVVLRFDRSDLVNAGVVSAGTTEIEVVGQLADGTQIIATVPLLAR